ncbi:hypothetical protein ASZ90_019275 [hydrocarbon metagenome]|uniref:Uncharacterized protein n=1 Tax=hydrocarbon metagenome TaxID=938273 RepID=A0A0W8E3S6_9ZZZZ
MTRVHRKISPFQKRLQDRPPHVNNNSKTDYAWEKKRVFLFAFASRF